MRDTTIEKVKAILWDTYHAEYEGKVGMKKTEQCIQFFIRSVEKNLVLGEVKSEGSQLTIGDNA